MNRDNDVEVHFALTKLERGIFESLVDHDTDGPAAVRTAIEDGPLTEFFTAEELTEVSPMIDRTLTMFERAGLIEHGGTQHGWNWRESSYRLSPRANELTAHRRAMATAGI